MTQTVQLHPICSSQPRRHAWIRHAWIRRLLDRRWRPSFGRLPKIDPAVWSARMLQDVGLDEREIGGPAYPNRALFDRFGR